MKNIIKVILRCHLEPLLSPKSDINIKTIGGPLLYGHITITEQGLDKYRELKTENHKKLETVEVVIPQFPST